MSLSITKTFLLALFSILLAISLMLFPQESLDASIRGMQVWWNVVFPSLLPFFIVSELLIGFGVVSLIGAMFEPFMRPLFRVPGVGGFVWAMGLASGNPAGAKITAHLRKEEQISRIEAERLVCFTNSANPLFIFGAIAVGFFGQVQLGMLLALSHYLGNVVVGLLMRFYRHDEDEVTTRTQGKTNHSVIHAFTLVHRERLKDGRPFGKLLGDAVQSSIKTLLMIGGFIILFSVLNKILSLVGVTAKLAAFFSMILSVFHLPTDLSIPFVAGLFEITIGSQLVSESTTTRLFEQVIVTSFLLAFSGFSIQAQVASILAETDISFKPFFISRILHGFFSALFIILLWRPMYLNRLAENGNVNTITVFLSEQQTHFMQLSVNILSKYGSLFTFMMLLLFILLMASGIRKGDSR